jgi:surface antigen
MVDKTLIGFADVKATNAKMVQNLGVVAKSQATAGNRSAADELNGEAQTQANEPNKVSGDAIYATLKERGKNVEFLDNVMHRDPAGDHGLYDEAQFTKVMNDLTSADLLKDVYQSELGRLPDGQGLKDFSAMIENLQARGLTGDALKAEITERVQASDEYAQKHPELAPAAGSGDDTAIDSSTDGQPHTGATGKIPADALEGSNGGECVVFVEAQTGHYFPVGAAAQMLQNGNHPGYDVVHAPRPGDVFVMTGGEYGHTGFVKSVNNDGSITVIDSNSKVDHIIHVHNYPASSPAGYLRRNNDPPLAYSRGR